MPALEEVKAKADALRRTLRELDKLTGKLSSTERGEKERERQRQLRAAAQRSLQHIQIHQLTDQEKVERKTLEGDNEAWIWEMCGPKSGLLTPLTRPFTSDDSDMIGTFFESLEFGGDSITLASRGGGKTSRLRECICKALLQGVLSYGVYFGATEIRHGRATMQAVKEMLKRSKGIAKYYPEVVGPIRKVGNTPTIARNMIASGSHVFDDSQQFAEVPLDFQWSDEGVMFPRVPGSPSFAACFQAFGLDAPVRGLNILGRRPDGIFIDDPDTPNTVRNRDICLEILRRIDLDLGGLRGEGRKMCRTILATLSSEGAGVAHRLTAQESAFVVRRHRFLLTAPQRMDLWMIYVDMRRDSKRAGDMHGRKAHDLYVSERLAMDAGGAVANPHRFDGSPCPDGSPTQLSALQYYFDEWADKGERFCKCELDNERVERTDKLIVSIHSGRMLEVVGDLERGAVDSTSKIIVRGIDIRKTEIHYATIADEQACNHLIIDYDLRYHGTSETTVSQAESLILSGLRDLTHYWDASQHIDQNGMSHKVDLTLLDKGWLGTWKNEEGEWKSWATQPVETFCVERGLRRWLPAKGLAPYRSPVPSDECAIGDHWHLLRGEGRERKCTEVIWDAEYWPLLVEELFMLPDKDKDRFTLFIPRDGVHTNHKPFGEHITIGAENFKEQKNAGQRSRKPRFVRDHWWDCLAMALVAQSVESWMRANVKPAVKRAINMPRENYDEIGAR